MANSSLQQDVDPRCDVNTYHTNGSYVQDLPRKAIFVACCVAIFPEIHPYANNFTGGINPLVQKQSGRGVVKSVSILRKQFSNPNSNPTSIRKAVDATLRSPDTKHTSSGILGDMTEPRARAARHKGQLNFENDSEYLLPVNKDQSNC